MKRLVTRIVLIVLVGLVIAGAAVSAVALTAAAGGNRRDTYGGGEALVWVESSDCTRIVIGYEGISIAPWEHPGYLWINGQNETRQVMLHYADPGYLEGEIVSEIACSGPFYIVQAVILNLDGNYLLYDLQGVEVSCYTIRLPLALSDQR